MEAATLLCASNGIIIGDIFVRVYLFFWFCYFFCDLDFWEAKSERQDMGLGTEAMLPTSLNLRFVLALGMRHMHDNSDEGHGH